MWTIRPNLDAFDALRGSKTLSLFADELELDKSTVSRTLSRKRPSTAGPNFVGHVLHHFPDRFDVLFDVVEIPGA